MHPTPDAIALLMAALGAISLPPSDLDRLKLVLGTAPERLTLDDLGLDSLGRLEACIALEIEHGVLITPEDLAPLHDADQLLRCIAVAPRL